MVMKKQDIEEDSIKRGAGTVYGFMGGLARKMGMVLLRGGLIPPCTLCTACKYSFSDF